MSDNKITRVGAADLAEALEDHNRSIHTLRYGSVAWLYCVCRLTLPRCSVSFNRIHAGGAQELLYALAFNPTITNLKWVVRVLGGCWPLKPNVVMQPSRQ